MELTSDLTGIQNIISECERQAGELAKIKHKGGNEAKIALVVDKIKQFLLSKNYITEPFDHTLVNAGALSHIILFIILNTKLNDETLANNQQFAHLINIMPKISKFLLINVVIENDLIEIYISVAFTLPLQIVPELFESANDIFIGVKGDETLKHVSVLVKGLIEKVNVLDIQENKVFEAVRDINNIIGKLLMYLSVHPSISMPNASETSWGLHTGYTLYNLFKMLLLTNEQNMACGKIVDALVLTTSIVAKHVTVNTYCAWAEVEEDDMPLQYAIGTEAYKVIEKYTKFKPAAELISMLTCMAKKPKSLSEIIFSASLQKMVNHINEQDENQRRWFSALLAKSDIFDHAITRQCLERWSPLCTLDDVLQLLQLANSKDEGTKRLAIKCAAHLSIQNLSILIARSFWIDQPWKPYIERSSAQQSLTLVLNKLNHKEDKEDATIDLTTDIQLLLLEKPKEVVEGLFKECVKNAVYVQWLEGVFKALRNVMSMNQIPLMILKDIIEKYEDLNSVGGKTIYDLFTMLTRTECTDINNLYTHVLKPLICSFGGDNSRLDVLLQVIKDLDVTSLAEVNKEELILYLLNFLEKHRIKYTEFCHHRIGICMASINIISKLSNSLGDMTELQTPELSKLNSYYLLLSNENSKPSFLNHVFPNFVTDNYGNMISKLIKILSRSVPQEWLQITEELAINLGTQKAIECLTDSLILICEVTNTQSSENVTVFSALSFYLQNYGICIQKMREKDTSLQFETNSVKSICQLIQKLPKEVMYKEGIHLITLFSEIALKSLSKDKHFVKSLVNIEDTNLTQIIAKKMLN